MAGSIFGGWLPAKFLKMGWSLNAARKTALLICALAVVPISIGATAGKLWMAVALIGLATAAHQGGRPTSSPWPPHRRHTAVHGQLRSSLCDRGLGVPDRSGGHSLAPTEAGTSQLGSGLTARYFRQEVSYADQWTWVITPRFRAFLHSRGRNRRKGSWYRICCKGE